MSDTRENQQRIPLGSIALGAAVGAAIGAAVGVALDFLALGMGFGTGMGIAIGLALPGSRQHSDKRKPSGQGKQ